MASRQKGFTILELMIAISVFGVAMLLFTMGALQVSRSYQQATVKTKLTSATRELHQEFSQGIEYNGTEVLPPVVGGDNIQRICFNGKRYLWNTTPGTPAGFTSYELREQLMTSTNGITCASPNYALDAKNPLPKDSRATRFGLTTGANIYRLETRFIAGEDDMFKASDPKGECRSAVLGGDFCATVEQASTVTRKVL